MTWFQNTEKEKTLPNMYWISKMHKNTTGASFIVVSKICSTKQISKSVSNVFKFVYSQIENLHKKINSYQIKTSFKVLGNPCPIIRSLNNINKKSVSNLLLQHLTFWHYTQSYLMINWNINFHPLLILLLKEWVKLLLDYQIMVQHTEGGKLKGTWF